MLVVRKLLHDTSLFAVAKGGQFQIKPADDGLTPAPQTTAPATPVVAAQTPTQAPNVAPTPAASPTPATATPAAPAASPVLPINFTKVAQAFGAADAAKLLVSVSALACIVAYLSNRSELKEEDAGEVFLGGVLHLFTPCLILISVWILSSTIKELGAAEVLSHLLEGNLPPSLFPAVVFLVGTLISFTTGSSWGTMGVLMPLALPVAIFMESGPETASILVPQTVAAVFSGAVFGDHCSPLSDTTIVASIACDLEPLEHVRTQIPYALIAAGVALFVGFIPSGFGLPSWISLIVGIVILFILAKIFGTSSNASRPKV